MRASAATASCSSRSAASASVRASVDLVSGRRGQPLPHLVLIEVSDQEVVEQRLVHLRGGWRRVRSQSP